jgi:cell division protein FtsN
VLEIEDKIPFMITPEVREQSNGFRPYLKYAAVILLAFATGLTGLRFYNNTINDLQLVQEEAQEQVARNIQEATFFNTAPLELPALKLEITKKNQVHYHIVAGGFRAQENADKKVAQLTEKGFEASNLGINKHGLHLVAYGSFTNVEEALQYLRQIKRTESSDAWLFQE